MQLVAKLHYTHRLVSQAVRGYWLRSMGFGMLIAVAIVLALCAWRLLEGDRSWVMGLLAAATTLAVAMPVAVYFVHYRNSMAKFHKMTNPVATLVVEDASFALTSDAGTSTLKWDAVTELWRFQTFWLFLFSKAHFATIPLDGMSEEMQSYVIERVRAAGGKVAV